MTKRSKRRPGGKRRVTPIPIASTAASSGEIAVAGPRQTGAEPRCTASSEPRHRQCRSQECRTISTRLEYCPRSRGDERIPPATTSLPEGPAQCSLAVWISEKEKDKDRNNSQIARNAIRHLRTETTPLFCPPGAQSSPQAATTNTVHGTSPAGRPAGNTRRAGGGGRGLFRIAPDCVPE